MPNIVIEGPDGAGKSTLAERLIEHLPLKLQKGEGPPKSQVEIIQRVQSYLEMDYTLFDRHPCISQPIYGMFRKTDIFVPGVLITEFYAQNNFIIYMHGRAGNHKAKKYDTKEHLDTIHRYDGNIRNAYEEWAPFKADITCTTVDVNFDLVLHCCKEHLK